MREIVSFEKPVVAIVHFAPEEGRPLTRQVYYQVVIDPEAVSPEQTFIRFNQDSQNEIHGWVLIDDICIDEILETLEVEEQAAA